MHQFDRPNGESSHRHRYFTIDVFDTDTVHSRMLAINLKCSFLVGTYHESIDIGGIRCCFYDAHQIHGCLTPCFGGRAIHFGNH